ncbi:MAG TPA: outer membrane beta-barrel protein [Cyclobacteriaceae bacterium]|nr:outer membrane beta-barrel protein [Cyclobacteriaceae bacterium]
MRKVFLTMMTGLGFAVMANAQTDKGNVMLGGNAAYDYSKVVDVDGNTQRYEIMPQVGFFVQDNFALGLGVGYSGSTEKNAMDIKSTVGEFAVSPFARLYKGEGPLKFFGQLSVPMGWGTSKVDGNKTANTERYGAAVSPGIAYFPTEKLAIELSVKGLYYEHTATKPEVGPSAKVNEFGLNANSLLPTVGVNFFF